MDVDEIRITVDEPNNAPLPDIGLTEFNSDRDGELTVKI